MRLSMRAGWAWGSASRRSRQGSARAFLASACHAGCCTAMIESALSGARAATARHPPVLPCSACRAAGLSRWRRRGCPSWPGWSATRPTSAPQTCPACRRRWAGALGGRAWAHRRAVSFLCCLCALRPHRQLHSPAASAVEVQHAILRPWPGLPHACASNFIRGYPHAP